MISDVVFPDGELLLTTYLRTALAARPEDFAGSVFVSNRTPNPRRTRMVIVRRDGGPTLDVTREAARFGFNVWAGTEQDAADLSRLVRALLLQSPDGDPVCAVNYVNGPLRPSEESEQPTRYLSGEFVIRGTTLPADLTA